MAAKMATMIGDVTDLQGRAGGGGVTLHVRPRGLRTQGRRITN